MRALGRAPPTGLKRTGRQRSLCGLNGDGPLRRDESSCPRNQSSTAIRDDANHQPGGHDQASSIAQKYEVDISEDK